MSDDDAERQVLQLVEEALVAGVAPDEVCAARPDLAPAVRERWRQYRQLEAEVDVLFPSSDPPLRGGVRPAHRWADLPDIPGYAVESVLGRGGAGVVYLARHLRLDRAVAVKMLLSGPHAGRIELARFLSEARAVAGLRHPNVVQVHDVGELDGRPFYTMEYLGGGSLADRPAGVPCPAAQAAALVATLADAVESFHRRGIVHRDLKPGNVLLTTDGTPKISDFGLARRVDDRGALTVFGTAVGTPGYMAPEQAAGRANAAGPAVDVYALGAILHELLSGRPPAAGDSTDPPASTARVPRDLRTICQKCMAADPARRYATAVALADDLRRFGRGEPVVARPVPWPAATAKWVRRRPATAVAVAAITVAAVTVAGGTFWLTAERARVATAVERDLDDAARSQQRSAWPEAGAAIERAAGRLGDGGSDRLHQRLERTRRDSALAARLEGIRLSHARTLRGVMDCARFDADFADAFRDGAVGVDTDDPAAVAARIRNSNVRAALVAAVNEWTCWAMAAQRRQWLRAVAAAADPDPDPRGWWALFRSPATWQSAAAVADLVRTTRFADRPVPNLLAIGRWMTAAGQDPAAFLVSVQGAHPTDLWANVAAGDAMVAHKDWPEAIRYYQAAVAVQPDAAVVHNDLGYAMMLGNRLPEAIAELREAVRLDPAAPNPRAYLGLALCHSGSVGDGVGQLRAAVNLDPANAWYPFTLADQLAAAGRDAEATESYRQTVALDPGLVAPRHRLRTCLVRQRRLAEACDAWRVELDADPPALDAWDGYAELCLLLGRDADYRQACRRLLNRFGDSDDPAVCVTVGRACLLCADADVGQRRRATAAIDRALTQDHGDGVLFAKALADYRGGDFAAAASMAEGLAGRMPGPGLLSAMAEWRLGHADLARRTLAKAVDSFDWSPARSGDASAWTCHVLRRQAEDVVGGN